MNLRLAVWIRLVSIAMVIGAMDHRFAAAQQTYQLSASGLSAPSIAILHQNGLVIRDAAGQESYYRRDSKLDSQDEQWSGYYSSEARQAVQWPQSNQGPMRIGTMDRSQEWQFRMSRMTIQPNSVSTRSVVLPNSNPPSPTRVAEQELILPDNTTGRLGQLVPLPADMNQAPIPIHLGMGDANRRRFLARSSSGGLNMIPQSAIGSQSWYIAPLANGLARVQYVENGTVLALGFQSDSSPMDLYAVADRADQLWRVSPCPGAIGSYALESLQYPGQALTYQQNRLMLAPINYASYQQWWPTAPIMPAVQPLYRSVNQNVIPNPALPPVEVSIHNSQKETLIVLVADRRNGGQVQKLRIPSGASEPMLMDRDSGSTIIETFEIRSNFGDWDRRQFRTPVPPSPIYDISVYEEFLQSIAIDRTGTSPNPIEDINYQPRSIGLFIVPPGAGVPERARLDVYRLAEAANNAGAVRRLNTKDYEHKQPNNDPLKDILREFQGRRAAF
ncbi:MAG: hypothetical protein SGI77_17825 [Pirellulaceae bacterium]|nr:hypothetical protein [Pirellulaceae bacterium]